MVKVGVEARRKPQSGRCFKVERENFLKRKRFPLGEQEVLGRRTGSHR